MSEAMLLHAHAHVLPAAYALLPTKMQSPRATAMLLAIGLQESRFEHRTQIGGPAHGFWQFERGGGVRGVLTHPSTAHYIAGVMDSLCYAGDSTDACYQAIVHNDVLAACFARLLLWTVPGRLPDAQGADAGWQQYLDGWRPGKPHPETWRTCFDSAWNLVTPLETHSASDIGSDLPGGGSA